MMPGKPPLARLGVLGRRLAYRVHRHLLRSPFLVARERRFGLRFRFKVEDAIGRCIYQNGVYEEELTRFLVEDLVLCEGDLVVDAGANLGWFSVLLDHVAPKGVTIYAFEPDPKNFELLTENLERNGAGGVVPVREALAERSGRRRLYLYPDKNRGRHCLGEMSGTAGTVDVSTITLDRFFRERGLHGRSVGLLKVDVEGFEVPVLEGAAGVLDRCRMVTTEYAPALIRRSGHQPERLLEHLSEFGFEAHRVEGAGLERTTPAELEGSDELRNLVWIRPGAGGPGST